MRARLYLFRWTKASKRQIIRTPAILSKAVFTLGLLLCFAYGITLLDTWLHVSSRSVIITQMSPYESGFRTDFGRQINVTYCTTSDEDDTVPYDASSQATPNNLCGLEQSSGRGFTESIGEGMRTLSNSSSINKVVYTDDQTAIMAPSYLLPTDNVAFEANTIGIHSACQRYVENAMDPWVGFLTAYQYHEPMRVHVWRAIWE